MQALARSGRSFLAVTDTGAHFVVAFADGSRQQVRVVDKPKDFDAGVLALRNDLAERQYSTPSGRAN